MKRMINIITDKGCKRETNEDGFFINGLSCPNIEQCEVKLEAGDKYLCAVVDGVGGCAHGEIATEICVRRMGTLAIPETEGEVVQLLESLNDEVCSVASQIETACTIAGICSTEQQSFWFNVGDSRIYEVSHGYLNQLSTDDTASGLSGDLSEGKEPLLQYLGKKGIVPHIGVARKKAHYLICSDGLTDMVSLDEIEDIMASAGFDEIGISLINAAKNAGGEDNITVAVIGAAQEEE